MTPLRTRRAFLRQMAAALPCLALGSASAARAAAGKAGETPAEASVPAAGPVSLDFLSEVRELMPRSRWTDVCPKSYRMRLAHGFTRLTVHHSGGFTTETAANAVSQQLENTLTGHLSRRYGDLGYHLVIDYAGRVWEGRSLAYEGAHVLRQNAGNIGVMVLGNFEQQQLSAAQSSTVYATVHLLRRRFRIPGHRVYGHRDLGHSLCPGVRLYEEVLNIRKG